MAGGSLAERQDTHQHGEALRWAIQLWLRLSVLPPRLLKPIYVHVRSNSEKLPAVDRSRAVDRVTEPIEAGHLTLTEVRPRPGERLKGVNHKTQGPSFGLVPVDENRLPPSEAGVR